GKLPPEPGKNAKQEEIDQYVSILKDTTAYKEAMKQYGTGSDLQKAAQAVTAALQGLAGGNISQALAGGLSPYAAEQIKKYTGTNETANALAHAVWGAIAAQVSGNSAAAGAAGAAGGELAARYLAEKLYGADTPEKIAKLSEEQKQSLSALSTLAAGLAGGVTGDSTANAVAGAQAGKNAVENNALGCTPLTCKSTIDPLNGGGGIIGGIGGAGLGVAIADALNGDKETESGPNVGKDLTDAEKAEVGGAGSGTPPPSGNNNDNKDGDFSTSDQRSIRSLEEQIREHEAKLDAYKKDPDAFDNKGHLKNAPNDEVRQRIIDGRIRHLEHEIETFNKNINEIKNGKG
ncbi:VENN motif pre-toxin domain-containing protein, partial [Serratia fonticola]|uniref:VENN motif pre-toxin domain-containing protein n=1 Tax=Serratia fonticola TaxID=47917 RepID=UPI001646AAD3